jgi:hypothetical protein
MFKGKNLAFEEASHNSGALRGLSCRPLGFYEFKTVVPQARFPIFVADHVFGALVERYATVLLKITGGQRTTGYLATRISLRKAAFTDLSSRKYSATSGESRTRLVPAL